MISYGRQSISKDDIEMVLETLMSDWLTQGPKIDEFEESLCAYTGAKYAVAVANGTAALHLACLAAGVKKGDEGITSTLTFVASANAIEYCGGKARFTDIDPGTGLMDVAGLEETVSGKTKVVIPVHYAGQSCEMGKIAKIAKKHDLMIIEDAAHAIGSEFKGKRVGCCEYADMCIFSFHPVKNMTTGEGGAITTNDKGLYRKLMKLRTHGISKDARDFDGKEHSVEPWYYQMQELGFNYRLTDMQAALGISQLKRLDEMIEKRRLIVEQYDRELSGMTGARVLKKTNHKSAFHLYPLLVDFEGLRISKVRVFDRFRKAGISLQVHYIPVHTQPYYKSRGYEICDYPQAEKFYFQEISLPLYPDMSVDDIKRVVSVVKEVVG